MSSHRADAKAAPARLAAVVAAPAPVPGRPVASGPLYAVPAPQFTETTARPSRRRCRHERDGRRPKRRPIWPPAAGPRPRRRLRRRASRDPDQGQRRDPATAADGKVEPASTPTNSSPTGRPGRDRAGQGHGHANLDAVVPQGAVIPAVMETAINSDLPGLARAMVTRDVKSFDGSTVLIPRGSRVIGQYKSGVALGASRVFVIWTRVIRPDGVTIQIGSPAADPLGRGGLEGKVDRHFFTRFGGSILMSVLNAGVAAVSNVRTNSQIYIGSATEAANLANSAKPSTTSRPSRRRRARR
jgi:type IV secretory pathway VirB10-like protein